MPSSPTSVSFALAVVALALPSTGIAQALPVARPVAPASGGPSIVATATPAPPPQTYTIELADQPKCLGAQFTTTLTEQPYIRMGSCRSAGRFRQRRAGGGRVTLEFEATGKCATVARGVLVGAPRIDLLPCAGAPDQLFRWEPTGIARVEKIQTINGKCVSFRPFNGDIVEVQCAQVADQAFRRVPINF